MNTQLIARLRNGEIAAENNGTLEQLREVLKAAFPNREIGEGNWPYYSKDERFDYLRRELDIKETPLPTVPITDFFKEDRAVELLRELVDGYYNSMSILYGDKINEAEQFLNELNKDK